MLIKLVTANVVHGRATYVLRRECLLKMSRGTAAAVTRIFRGDESRRPRRGSSAETSRETPRLRRGNSGETGARLRYEAALDFSPADFVAARRPRGIDVHVDANIPWRRRRGAVAGATWIVRGDATPRAPTWRVRGEGSARGVAATLTTPTAARGPRPGRRGSRQERGGNPRLATGRRRERSGPRPGNDATRKTTSAGGRCGKIARGVARMSGECPRTVRGRGSSAATSRGDAAAET